MKKLLIGILTVSFLVAGCTTTGKLITTSRITVDHAMQGWAVWVADGHATIDQRKKVSDALSAYDKAEDVALTAYELSVKTGDKSVWGVAREAMDKQQANLLGLIEAFTGKDVTP